MAEAKELFPETQSPEVFLTIPRALDKANSDLKGTSTTYMFPLNSKNVDSDNEVQRLGFRGFLLRLYRSFLIALIFVTCSYGIISFALEFSVHRTENKIGLAWIETSTDGSHTLYLIGEFRLANTTKTVGKLLRNHTYGLAYALLSSETPSNDTMRIILNLHSQNSQKVTKRNGSNLAHTIRKRSLDNGFSPDLEAFSSYDDDYPIRFDVKSGGEHADPPRTDNETGLRKPAATDAEAEARRLSYGTKIISTELPADLDYSEPTFNGTVDPYAEKCRDYWTQFQQQQIFSAANREILNIRDKIERALPHAEIQLDAKEGEIPAGIVENRLLTQRAMYEVLKKFGGAPETSLHKEDDDDKAESWKELWM